MTVLLPFGEKKVSMGSINLLEDLQGFLADAVQVAPQRGQGFVAESGTDAIGGIGQSPDPRSVRGAALPKQPVNHIGDTQQIDGLC